MGTFASTILSGNNFNASQLKTELEALPCRVSYNLGTSLVSTSSTSMVTLVDVVVSNISSDDIILLMAEASYSYSPATNAAYFELYRDSTAIGLYSVAIPQETSNLTGGSVRNISKIAYAQDLSGTVTFSLKYASTTSHTIYATNRYIAAFQFKRRS